MKFNKILFLLVFFAKFAFRYTCLLLSIYLLIYWRCCLTCIEMSIFPALTLERVRVFKYLLLIMLPKTVSFYSLKYKPAALLRFNALLIIH